MFVTLKKDYLGHRAGAMLDILEEPVVKSLVEQGIAEATQGDPYGPLMAKAMEATIASLTKNIETVFNEAIRQFGHAQSKSRRNAVPAIFGEGNDGDPKKTFGHFLLAVRSRDVKTLEEMGSRFCEWDGSEKKAAMNTQTGAQGGYLVPTEFYNRLMMLATERSIVRQRATIVPMSARSVKVPVLDMTTAPAAGDSAFLGGLVGRWTEEATGLNESEPGFKEVELINYELSGYSKISNTLLADGAIGLEAFLMQLFARAIAWYEDYAFLRGNGVGKPLGAITWAGLISVARSAASAFALADYAGMLARWLPNYDPKSSCWACHPTVLAKLYQLAATNSITLFIDNVRDTPRHMLAGLPLEVSEKLPALNTAGDILLGDWSQYLIGDRQQVEIAFSEHAGFTTNQTFWRFVCRVAGMPWLKDKITLADAASSISPFVALAAG